VTSWVLHLEQSGQMAPAQAPGLVGWVLHLEQPSQSSPLQGRWADGSRHISNLQPI